MLNQRAKLLAGWKKLPSNKPSWETWKRMTMQYHNEALAWEKWASALEKKERE